MPVTVVIVIAGLVAAGVVWALSRTPAVADPIDPEREERWLVTWLARHPALATRVRAIDARVSGGLMLVVGLAIVFLTALVVGGVADMIDENRGFARWDRAVADWGSRNATPTSTRVLDHVTDLGATTVVAVIAIAVAAVDLRLHRNRHVVAFLAASVLGVSIVNNVLKLIVGRERPDVVHLVHASGNSFPSGHSATAAAAWCAFALVLTRHRGRRSRSVAAGIAALVAGTVAASRALLGVHWLSDVLAGLALGWGWFLLCALVFGGRIQRLGDPAAAVGAPAPPVVDSPESSSDVASATRASS